MKKNINYSVLAIAIALLFSCKPQVAEISSDLPYMPMTATYENSLEYIWQNKKVLDSRLLSDMETIDRKSVV